MATMTSQLFSTVRVGSLELPNRMMMSAMTRRRAGEGAAPTALNAEYYRQRASAGLIVAEATQISEQGFGFAGAPGIHSLEQIAGWRLTTDAVHSAGGRIFLQLCHCGRASHSFFHGGELPVAPSPIAIQSIPANLPENQNVPFETPRPLELREIPAVINQYRQAARNAMQAGFDGVEIHAAYGCLVDQFLQDGSNQRNDEYGGTPANRARFLLEATQAAADVWGVDRVGVKFTPSSTYLDMRDSDPANTFSVAVAGLNNLGIAYVHIVEASQADIRHGGTAIPIATFRPLFHRTLVVNQEYDLAKSEAVLAKGDADVVSFARLFLANPDLPARFARNLPLNPLDPATLYGGDSKGYTDYPYLASDR